MNELESGWRRFQRGWRIPVILAALCIAGALVWSLTATPIYRASAKFLVYPTSAIASSRDVVSSMDTLDKRTISTTYADILASERIYTDTVSRLNLKPDELKGVTVRSQVQESSNILVLSVEGPDSRLITLLANNLGQNGISFIRSVYQVYEISFLDSATQPETPVSPRPLMDSLIAAGIGIGLGLLVLVGRETLRVPLESLRQRSITDQESGASTQKYAGRKMAEHFAAGKTDAMGFGLIRLRGLEDISEGLPLRVRAALLRHVVGKLRSMLRGNDLVGRWDAMTMSVMLPATPETPAIRTFERLLEALREAVQVEDAGAILLEPRCAVVFRRPEDSPAELTARAQTALTTGENSAEPMIVVK